MVNKKQMQNEIEEIAEKTKNTSRQLFKTILKIIKNFNICDFKIGKTEIKISKYGKGTIYFTMIICFISLLCTGLGFLTTTLLFAVLFTLCFFRDPDRVINNKKNSLVSPTDGVVLRIESSSLPEELNEENKNGYTKISILLKITDVHIQRIPVNCIVKKIEYIRGAFINASFDKASKENERNIVLLERKNGDKLCICQIAGLISRRIICEIKQDENCEKGEKYGMIKFGSRVELYIPKNYNIEILEGQRVIAGETIIASF